MPSFTVESRWTDHLAQGAPLGQVALGFGMGLLAGQFGGVIGGELMNAHQFNALKANGFVRVPPEKIAPRLPPELETSPRVDSAAPRLPL